MKSYKVWIILLIIAGSFVRCGMNQTIDDSGNVEEIIETGMPKPTNTLIPTLTSTRVSTLTSTLIPTNTPTPTPTLAEELGLN